VFYASGCPILGARWEPILAMAGEGASASPTPDQWRMFEGQVARVLEKLDPGAEVQHDARVQGVVSKTERQVDVLIRGRVAGREVGFACECKRYATKAIGIDLVDQMVGKVLDIGASVGIMYAFGSYIAPAKARAEGAKYPEIELRELPAEENPDYTPLIERIKFGDCPNPNCILGDISWHSWPDDEGGPPVMAGFCNACGTLAVECNDEACGDITALDLGEQQCDNCEAVYQRVETYQGEFEGVVRIS
jgi:hypothetical protein